ncbi:unnamed protein product, partial [Prorocentrum cordatum]
RRPSLPGLRRRDADPPSIIEAVHLDRQERVRRGGRPLAEQLRPRADPGAGLRRLRRGARALGRQRLRAEETSSKKRLNHSSTSSPLVSGLRRETDFLRRDSLSGGRLAAVMASPHVEVVTGCLILLNTLVMAVEQQHEGLVLGAELSVYSASTLDDWPLTKADFELMEKLFAATFTLELGLHIFAERWKYLNDVCNIIDVVVVVLSDFAAFGPAIWVHFNFQVFRLLRIARLLRLLRLIRRIKARGARHDHSISLQHLHTGLVLRADSHDPDALRHDAHGRAAGDLPQLGETDSGAEGGLHLFRHVHEVHAVDARADPGELAADRPDAHRERL